MSGNRTVMASDAGGSGRELSLLPSWGNVRLGGGDGYSEWTVSEGYNSGIERGRLSGRRKLVKRKELRSGDIGGN